MALRLVKVPAVTAGTSLALAGRETRRGSRILCAVNRISSLAVAAAVLFVGTALVAAQTAAPVVVTAPDGRTLEWSRWLADAGPAAVLLWSSWSPRGDEALAELEAIEAACRERGLELVLVAVQEELEESAAALRGRDLRWLHDRHGMLLKRYRVVRVPSLLVLDGRGEAVARLQPTPEALRASETR